MSRRGKLVRNGVLAAAASLLILAAVAIQAVQTDWFRNYLKQKIVASTEKNTGGKVDVGSFAFDWRSLHAIVTDFVIHGNEPAGTSPFLRARRIDLKLRLFGSVRHALNLSYLGIDQPEANIMVFPDGHTNVPTPQQPSHSSTTALEDVVDLAVGHFELTNGLLVLNSQQQPFHLHADDMRAQLRYSIPLQGYLGQISLEPIYAISGRNTPVKVALTLPLALGRERIALQGATLSTAASQVAIDISIEDLRKLNTSVHINGHLALADLKNVGDLPIALGPREALKSVDLDASATLANDVIEVTGIRVGVGRSVVEASGQLKDVTGNGSLEFRARLALDELSRLAKIAAQPQGAVMLQGTAKLDADNNYQVAGTLEARSVSFLTASQPGARRIGDFSLDSQVRLDQRRLNLDNFWLAAYGGQIGGNATLEDFARYQVNADLRNLDLGIAAARAMGQKNVPYSGIASGPISVQGNLNTPGTRSISGSTRISVEPGTRGMPMAGRIHADYDGASDNLRISDSRLTLPHTSVTLTGSLRDRLDVALTTRDLNDLLAAIPRSGKPPAMLEPGGQATLTATLTGRLTSPRINGHVSANRFTVQDRRFDTLALDASASDSGAAVSNGILTRGSMQAGFSGSVGLRDWRMTSSEPLSGDAVVRNGDLADIMVLTGRSGAEYSGALSAIMHLSGTAGNPLGSTSLSARNGMIQGESFDQIEAQVTMADQLITIPSAQAAAGTARVILSAEFQHPRDSLTLGKVHGRIQTNRVDLTQLRTLQTRTPNLGGEVQLQAEATGTLSEMSGAAHFLLTAASADVAAQSLRFEGQSYGDVTATARTRQQTVHYNLASNFAGSKISVTGDTQLERDYPTTADATIGGLPIERVLALAKRTDIPAKGSMSCTAHLTGGIDSPQGRVDFDLANAVLYDEPVDHVRGIVNYLPQSIDLTRLEALAGPSHFTIAGRYDHAAGNLQTGNLQFRLTDGRLDLGRVRTAQKKRPGLGGTVEIDATGTATVSSSGMRIQFLGLDTNVAATGIKENGKAFGDLKLAANTTGGRVHFALDSNLAGSSIHGSGYAALTGDYPINVDLAFSHVAWGRVHAMLGPGAGEPPSFEAVADGQATVSGPATKMDELRGSVKLTRVNLNALAPEGSPGSVVIQNDGPIVLNVDRGAARIDSFHLTGPETDLQARGSASFRGQLDLTINGNSNLAVLKRLNRNVVSSGSALLTATVRGTTAQPLVNGRLELHDAAAAYTGFSNGISNANGVVQFNGSNATVQNLTVESGGGRITLAGFVAYRDTIRFGLRANAASVRTRTQEGMSVIVDANVDLTGTPQASVLSGTATVNGLSYAPRSDFGAMLARAAPPVDVSAAPSPLLDNMRLDIQVRTSSATAVRSSLAQTLQADADLRILGTVSQPGALGRVNITEGRLVFFGSNYAVNLGTIGFYNPVRIEPVLNLSLETQTKGVDVVLRVTGPIDNMKLSYTSDPPLQFQEIVELLASGKVPTSDPTLLANQPAEPTQSLAQMGESAVVGKALADPASSQLQRVFGVSQFKIDPTFGSGSELPQARLTLQQHVATNVTFTYVTAVNDPNTQIIRIEWALNPQWSAVGMRDQNGILSIKFAYKKQFR